MKYEILTSKQVLKVEEVNTKSGLIHTVKNPNTVPFDMEFHTKLTTNKTSILADGIDQATITASVYNYLDEAQTTWSGDIVFEVDGIQETVPTTNGVATTTLDSQVAGEFNIKTIIPNFRNGEVKVVAG